MGTGHNRAHRGASECRGPALGRRSSVDTSSCQDDMGILVLLTYIQGIIVSPYKRYFHDP